MKHVRNGRIPTHMVGSPHQRFFRDVLALQEVPKEEKQQAVFALMNAARHRVHRNKTVPGIGDVPFADYDFFSGTRPSGGLV
jgi:hypothetical protein